MGMPSMGMPPMGMPHGGMDPAMLADWHAQQHAVWLQQQRAMSPEARHFVEPPMKKIRGVDDWLELHYKLIQRLVEEPMFAQPKVGEPALEVTIIGAQLHGPWPHPYLNNVVKPFVRHYIDTEMVGETKQWDEAYGDPRFPTWNSKMLVLPRGAKVSQFEVLTGTNMPLVLGDCAFNTETLWKCAQNCGRYVLNCPICYQGHEVGTLQVRLRMWDGMPLEEENTALAGLGGTLAGALDNEFMREFGPQGSRSGDGSPFPNATGALPFGSALPVRYNSGVLLPTSPLPSMASAAVW
jgi:hypothetical protein